MGHRVLRHADARAVVLGRAGNAVDTRNSAAAVTGSDVDGESLRSVMPRDRFDVQYALPGVIVDDLAAGAFGSSGDAPAGVARTSAETAETAVQINASIALCP